MNIPQTRFTDISQAQMEARIVRYANLRPCYNAFIDCRTPGSEAKENFTIIGPGVSENPDQYVHIAEPHGYNIGGARQPVGCVNSQHSHETAEVFMVHKGEWRFDLGEHGDDAHIALYPGDVISIPTRMFRGFTATAPAADGSPGFLWAVLGGDNPGRVTWAPNVFDMAADYGLVLLEDGMLIDTAAGQTVPEHARIMQRTNAHQVAAMHVPTTEEAQAYIWRNVPANDDAAHPIIGAGASGLNWQHGFAMVRLDVPPRGSFKCGGEPSGNQVRFVHSGSIMVETEDGQMTLNAGDTISLPDAMTRDFSAPDGAVIYAVWAA